MGPPPKRRRIDAPPASQVDEDIVADNRANGGSDVDSELEFEDDSDLGAVEDIEPEITPGQTMVLGLQSGKSWAEVESKLHATSYSGTCIKSIKKCQEEKKEHKKHVRKFNKMTPKARLRLQLRLLPLLQPLPLPLPRRPLPRPLLLYLKKQKFPVVIFSHPN